MNISEIIVYDGVVDLINDSNRQFYLEDMDNVREWQNDR